jgi:ligand-binding SRPBCC domain-containing protein
MIIERQSVVDAPAEQVWARVVTPEGINDEVRPWMTMSMPRGAESLTVDNVPIGVPIGRAWLRLFGVLPFDYDRLCIAQLDPGRGFDEQSTMMSMRQWRHQRTVTPDGDSKAVVRDPSHFSCARCCVRPHRSSRRGCAHYSGTGTGDCSGISITASDTRAKLLVHAPVGRGAESKHG